MLHTGTTHNDSLHNKVSGLMWCRLAFSASSQRLSLIAVLMPHFRSVSEYFVPHKQYEIWTKFSQV